jgi:hypothetical protein
MLEAVQGKRSHFLGARPLRKRYFVCQGTVLEEMKKLPNGASATSPTTLLGLLTVFIALNL